MKMAPNSIFITFFFVSLQLMLISGSRILLTPFPFSSHISELSTIGKTLQDRGHEVYIVLPESFPTLDKVRKGPIKVIIHKSQDKDIWMQLAENSDDQGKMSDEMFFDYIARSFVDELRTNAPENLALCTNLLGDQDLFQKLKGMKFNLAILDAFQFSRCFVILLYRLGIPYTSVLTINEPWLQRNPSLPSFVPFMINTGIEFPEMSFMGRLKNLWGLVEYTSRSSSINVLDDNLVSQFAPELPFVSINYLVGKSLLWLIDSDFVLDYPRPLMPNEVLIGGLTPVDAKPLPKDLQKFMDEATEGVVVVSFGSLPFNLPVSVTDKMITAFGMIEQKVVWRVPTGDLKTPPNVKQMTWMPQNDLLGHPNTHLFLTHCGANGQFESVYHGVPMLGMPMFGDQPYNAHRAKYKGLAEVLSLFTFTAEELVDNIQGIISNSSYVEATKRASAIFKNQPLSPRERAAFWVEHVLNYGGKHLHSHALEMPWYQYTMLDIAAFLLIGLVFVLLIMKMLINCFLGFFLKQTKEKTH